MNYLSICSGIEAATVAWHPLGWSPVAFAEIEAFPCAVLAHHYPDVPNLGDMTLFDEWPDPLLSRADLLVGGTPCQAFSVAGARGSLNDHRGNLTLTYARLLDRIDRARAGAGRPPALCLWENVPGVLNTPDNAFGCFLGLLAGEDGPLAPPGGRWTDAGLVRGPRRAIAWRCLDAQYFGLAQRRDRVFVVASAGAVRVEEILFEREGLRRDSPPRRGPGEGFAHDVAPCLGASGRGFERTGETRGQDCVVAHSETMPEIVGALPSQHTPHGHGQAGVNSQAVAAGHIIPVPLCMAHGQASAEIGIGTTLNCNHEAPIVFAENQRCEVREMEVAGALSSIRRGDAKNETLIAFSSSPLGDSTLVSPIAFNARQDPDSWEERTGPLDANGATQAVCFESRVARNGRGAPADLVPPLKAQSVESGKGDAAPLLAQGMSVRRITPRECERLQGFPDDYTAIPYRGKPAADGPRYKALGNSKAVPVVRWIGRRIEAACGGAEGRGDERLGPENR